MSQQLPASRQSGAGAVVAGLPVRADVIGQATIALAVLLVLLLIIGRGAGSG